MPASPWSRDLKSSARLIAGASTGSGAGLLLSAGLEITLEPGTKTYWRTPGDSGVPPHFDWSGSTNLAEVTVRWPAPMRFPDGNGFSIGYKHAVILPLDIVARDPAAPVVLALKLDYAVCEQVCIPAKAEASLRLGAGPAADPALGERIERSRDLVPTREAQGLGLKVTGIDRSGPRPVALLTAIVSTNDGTVDLFAEGPDSRWALPLPDALDDDGPVRRFRLDLDGVPRGADPLTQPLTFTLVAGARAIETTLTLS
ncbi:protein-disulfide reductase DsbD domain-containing protein [Phreatobacter aquaticus]|uniref:protein-disulfide reductase DsbD domain-containing protein n=1 Tax=Phreatobacter aquaticus TaxID=2570229 RepID=UPI00143D9FC7|nr:protein-disulfide reductase DsbD domain-containing protein [Phreatobacter aquaticus]